jgi:hypothetical protein
MTERDADMKRNTRLLLSGMAAVLLVAGLTACSSSTDRVDSGGVTLSITDFDGLPITVSVNTAVSIGFVQVGTIDVENIALDPTGTTSDLMDVEIKSYEVVYSRADSGTRIPTPYVRGLFGTAPVNGTFSVDNLPVMGRDQLLNEPLSDLLFENGGFDTETGATTINLNLKIRFFGRTLAGKAVETAPAVFTVEFTP